MRTRYYNTEIKRFINQDIVAGDIRNTQSLNRYCYVQGNPVSYMDPFGLSPLSSFVEGVHTFFNVVGFLPGAGVYADMANAILYLVEGKYGLAGFSVVAAIPGPGDGASLGFNIFKLSKRTKRILKTVGDGASVARDSIFSADIANEVYNRYVVEGEPLDDEGALQTALAVVNIGCSLKSAKRMCKNARNRSKMHSQSMSRTKGGLKADFYVKPNGDVIPSTGYRYSARNTTVIQNAKSGTIAARADGTYFSFDSFDDAVVAQGKLQIPYRPEYRIGFDTLDIIDDISIPNGKWGTASYLEPITNDFKNFGPGKATQAVTYSEINSVNEISKLR